jgi:hypothetical protein
MEDMAMLNRRIGKKIRKKIGWLVMMLGGVWKVHCIFPYMEGVAVQNEIRLIKCVKKYSW